MKSREEILKQYDVDESGRIKSPGKFEGEMLYVPFFWYQEFDDTEEKDGRTLYIYKLIEEDIEEFPELETMGEVILWENDQGFVTEV